MNVMKHIHFKSQVSAQGGICQRTVSSSPLLKNDPLSFQLLATVTFIVGQRYSSVLLYAQSDPSVTHLPL